MRQSGVHQGFDDQLYSIDERRFGSIFLGPMILVVVLLALGFILRPGAPSFRTVALFLGFGFIFWLWLQSLKASLPVGVGFSGIRAHDRRRKFVNLPWGRIIAVDRIKIFSLPYAVLTCTDDLELTIPLWIEDWSGFCAAIRTHAPPDCPLLAYLD